MSLEDTPGGSPAPGSAPPVEPLVPGAAAGPCPTEPAPGLSGRLAGILFSPGETFRKIAERPSWGGAFGVYLAIVAAAFLVYCLRVDWETVMRAQFEESLAWKLTSSFLSEGQLAEIERASLNQVMSLGRGGLTLTTVMNQVIFVMVGFHFMAVVFSTLFYLMGALADLKLGRVYLDGFLCFLLLIFFTILNVTVTAAFDENSRGALPYQAGLGCGLFVAYLWLFGRSVGRQSDFKRMVATYAHALAVPALALVVMVIVILVKQEPLTLSADRVVTSSLGGILSMRGTSPLAVILGAIDVFTIWGLTVASIGFAAASRLSMGTSVAITFLPWGFYTMARLAMAAAFGG